jgi:hypothetical protein
MARIRTDLESQIADDLARSDLADEITAAVNWALQYYQDDRFVFNEYKNCSATLSSSLNFLSMAVPPLTCRFQKIDRLRIEADNVYTELYVRDYEWIMNTQDNLQFGRPCAYCIYADSFQFDIGADQNYTINIDGVINLGSQASASFSANDTSAWFNDAAELIRSAVKRNLYNHIIKDERMASMAVEAEQDAYSMLKGQLTRKKSSGFIRPRMY